MLKKISMLGLQEVQTVTMKLSCVPIEWALYICPAVLLATQMLLGK